MMRGRERNPWIFLLLLLVGVVIGGFLGEFFKQLGIFEFLNYGATFGVSPATPFILDLGILQLSFALLVNINIFSIIGIVLAVIVFRKM